MYNIFAMTNKLEIFKKRLVYRASYRGTKEMDILLSSFVNKYIDTFDEVNLIELESFLDFDDEIILNFYNHSIVEKNIDKNKISKLFKEHFI
jgi:antitoxin CptB